MKSVEEGSGSLGLLPNRSAYVAVCRASCHLICHLFARQLSVTDSQSLHDVHFDQPNKPGRLIIETFLATSNEQTIHNPKTILHALAS
jgi:hypothetical protein